MMQAYGMTEAAPIVTLLDPRYTDARRHRSRPPRVVRPGGAGCEVKVVDAAARRCRGHRGESGSAAPT